MCGPVGALRPVVKRLMSATAIVAGLVIAFAGGRWSVPSPGVEIRRSEVPVWIEAWRGGELAAEWQEWDGEVFRVLDQVLRDDPRLYVPDRPGAPRSGRGPVLQEARGYSIGTRTATVSAR
jgi:hypothetical protein